MSVADEIEQIEESIDLLTAKNPKIFVDTNITVKADEIRIVNAYIKGLVRQAIHINSVAIASTVKDLWEKEKAAILNHVSTLNKD